LLLAIAPAAILYVVVIGQTRGNLDESEQAELLSWARVLEEPARTLWPAVNYPLFWHEHVAKEEFKPTVVRYFVGNFIAWSLLLALISIMYSFLRKVVKKLLRFKEALPE
jgi:hypothetical protein